jgi:hypothetical protein
MGTPRLTPRSRPCADVAGTCRAGARGFRRDPARGCRDTRCRTSPLLPHEGHRSPFSSRGGAPGRSSLRWPRCCGRTTRRSRLRCRSESPNSRGSLLRPRNGGGCVSRGRRGAPGELHPSRREAAGRNRRPPHEEHLDTKFTVNLVSMSTVPKVPGPTVASKSSCRRRRLVRLAMGSGLSRCAVRLSPLPRPVVTWDTEGSTSATDC